ncbi:MAG: hypothetical protein K6E47_14005 [Lachnospiraceae bacterium]|nr:hypothetical protein [Lachnospiraceae bacterium]
MKKKIILFLYFSVISYIVINVSGYVEKLHLNDNYSERPIMTDSVFFVINSESEYVDLSFIKENSDIDDFTLLSTDEEDQQKYHVIFSKGEYDVFYGKLPKNWDFDGTEQGAIIGKSRDISDTRIIAYIDDDGVYAREHAVFLLDAQISDVATNAIFVIASGKEEKAEKNYEVFSELCKNHGIEMVPVYMQSAIFGKYSENEPVLYLIVAVLWAVILFMAFVSSHLWFVSNKNYYRVLYMFGHEHPYIRVLADFVLISTLAYISQVVIYLLLSDYSIFLLKNSILFSTGVFYSQYLVLLHYPKCYRML